MIVIPVAVSLAVFFGGLHVFASLAGFDAARPRGGARPFMEAMQQASDMMDRWERDGADIAAMMSDAASFNARRGDREPVLLIYRDGTVVNEAVIPPDEDIIRAALGTDGAATIFGRTAIHVRKIGGVHAVLFEGLRLSEMRQSYSDVMFRGAVVSLICSCVIILLTNRFLTQFVFRRIIRAMDTLTQGVRQIRDGNLNFRIDYGGSDEFSPVCDDFNEMAGRLLSVEGARQRGEQSRRELIAGISHDLRTPLTSIKAYVEGIERGVASTPEAHERYMSTIRAKTDDLEHIIDTLFLFSKLDTGEFPYRIERVDLGAVVSEITDGLAEEYAARGLEISANAIPSGAFVDIDAAQMRYVLTNIFENSLKYKKNEVGHIDVSVTMEGESAALTLTDDGPGVPDEAACKLFDLFYRIDGSRSNPSRGSGLGLAIAAKMVKHFGGSIEAKNARPSGLSIIIRLPASEAGVSI
jgi:signal transduction histidine kinase